MLNVVTWKWGTMFSAEYVNRLYSMLKRHLHMEHRLVCVTDDFRGIEPSIECMAMADLGIPQSHCSQRMPQFSIEFPVGPRFLAMDLDVVIVDDITPLVDRPEQLVCWRVEYARMYAGGFILMNTGVLDGLWYEYKANPGEFSAEAKRFSGGSRDGSDQDMLNWYLYKHNISPATWTERDGLNTGYGVARRNHISTYWKRVPIAPGNPRKRNVAESIPFYAERVMPELPAGTRIVFVGHRDKSVMDDGAHEWVKEHWR